MIQISAAMIKDLRGKTGAGMMDCKKALTETEGDIESAVDWLRTKGLATAAKKAGRVASEGLVVAKGVAASLSSMGLRAPHPRTALSSRGMHARM